MKRYTFLILSFYLAICLVFPKLTAYSAISDTQLLAPVSAGQTLTIIHGYNDPLPNEKCVIGSSSDHCQNQRYGLDLKPSDQTKLEILAPLPGKIDWIEGNCLGIRTSDNLNLNVCHFGRFQVLRNSTVKRGDVLGTRSTSWIHISLDDRNRYASKPPVPFNGAHAIEGIAFDAGADYQRNVHVNKQFTSSNGSLPPPTAGFDSWPQNGPAPLRVSMHNISTGSITSCLWYYGDGTTGNSCAAYHDHVYTNPGSYTVQLVVSGPGGSNSQSRSGYINVSTLAPVANFDAWPQNGPAPLRVSMHNISTGTISGCNWYYGDGTTGNSCAAYHDHVYTSPGIYSVRLTVYGPGGSNTKVINNYISVSSPNVNCPGQYRAEYYNNPTLSGNPALVQCEGWPINHDWGGGGPSGAIGSDRFSARWTGQASFNAGTYTFIARADDGVRVWIDALLIIDQWRDQGATEYRHTRIVAGGTHTIKVEYYENGGAAVAQLRWEQSTSSSNLALRRPSFATSQQATGFEANQGNDGSTATRWSSQVANSDEWWWVDLGTQTFDNVIVRWEAAYAAQHFIGWSNDGTNFTGYWFTNSSAGSYRYDLRGSHTARYIAILMRTHAPGLGNYSFWEFEAYQGNAATLNSHKSLPDVTDIVPEASIVTIQHK